MAVEDHPLFAKWDAASKKRNTRAKWYEEMKGKYGDKHPIVKNAKSALLDADKELSDIIAQL